MKNYHNIKDAIHKLTADPLLDLFINNSNRFKEYSIVLDNLLFDYSKNYINKEILGWFIKEAQLLNFTPKVNAMFKGENLNFTENRAVLHVALRDPQLKPVTVNQQDYYEDIWNTFTNFTSFAEDIRTGQIKSSTNQKFTHIVNIGIGGSYLPVLANYEALSHYKDPNIKVYFVSNVDSIALQQVLQQVNLETTLFIVASKTFTTPETMLNAHSAKECLIKNLGKEAVKQHFVAITTNIKEAKEFGIGGNNIFGFWDFIGGRYSIWSSIALPLVIAIGKAHFLEFLEGAKVVDSHFKNAPLENNIPFIMAVLTIIYRNFMNTTAECIIPYCDALSKFPLYLQQVAMESNGKTVNSLGEAVNYKTSPVIFGEVGTNAQHSFFQLLHQGSDIIPIDFIGFVNTPNALKNHQDMLVANLIAQSEALMIGKTWQEVIVEDGQQIILEEGIGSLHEVDANNLTPHKVFKGSRPSNILFCKELTPKTMGMLCALYEHKVFTLGLFWEINSFDQFGVELGKKLAKNILVELQEDLPLKHDNSTTALINYYKDNCKIDE